MTEQTIAEKSAAAGAALLAVEIERAEAAVALTTTAEFQEILDSLADMFDPQDTMSGNLNSIAGQTITQLLFLRGQARSTLNRLVPTVSPLSNQDGSA